MIEPDARATAVHALRAAVQALTREKWRQLFADAVWTGLFCGLLAACVMVLLVRLDQLRLPIGASSAAFGLIGVALTAAALLAWLRRPDSLQVAIQTDVQLNLQQQLSTAWEFATARGGCDPAADAALGERLAAQAVRARLPMQPRFVFPRRINLWGRLTPVAAALLVFLGVVDLQPAAAPALLTAADQAVVDEGLQLREYARRMAARARRDALSHSTRAAQDLQRLGSRMAGGALARDEALERLRRLSADLDERQRAALSAGAGVGLDATLRRPTAGQSVTARTTVDDARLRTLLEELAAGRLTLDDARLSAAERQALSEFDMTTAGFDSALERLAADDDQGLRRIREASADDAAPAQDADELDRAQQRISRARAQLGDATLATTSKDKHDATGSDDAPGAGAVALNRDDGAALASPDGNAAAGYGDGKGREQRLPFAAQTEAAAGLKPVSRLRAGEVFSAPVRVLPRPGRAALDAIEPDARFSARLEQVLSKEEVPLHHKELIRRYFLTLSDGVAEPQP